LILAGKGKARDLLRAARKPAADAKLELLRA
jgi:ribosomal protein S5